MRQSAMCSVSWWHDTGQRLWPQLRCSPFAAFIDPSVNVPEPGATFRTLALGLLNPSKRPSRNCVEGRLDGPVRPPYRFQNITPFTNPLRTQNNDVGDCRHRDGRVVGEHFLTAPHRSCYSLERKAFFSNTESCKVAEHGIACYAPRP